MKTEQDFLEKKFSGRKTTEEWLKRLNRCKDPDEFDGLLFHAFDGREGDPGVARVLLLIAGAISTNEVQTMHCRTARTVLMNKFIQCERDERRVQHSDPPWFKAVRKDPSLLKLMANTLSEIYESRIPNSQRRAVDEFVAECFKYHSIVSGTPDMELMGAVNGAMFEIVQMIFACHLDISFMLEATPSKEQHWNDRQQALLQALERLVFGNRPVTKEMRATLMDPQYDHQMSNELFKYYGRRKFSLNTQIASIRAEIYRASEDMAPIPSLGWSTISFAEWAEGEERRIALLEAELAALPTF